MKLTRNLSLRHMDSQTWVTVVFVGVFVPVGVMLIEKLVPNLPSPPSPPSTDSEPQEVKGAPSGGLSDAQGAVAGVIVGVILLVVSVLCCLCRGDCNAHALRGVVCIQSTKRDASMVLAHVLACPVQQG
jgi:hypothetical protein